MTKSNTYKMTRSPKYLVLGEGEGYLELVDLQTYQIIHTIQFKDVKLMINDVVAIDDNQFLLGTCNGLFKTTREAVIYHD